MTTINSVLGEIDSKDLGFPDARARHGGGRRSITVPRPQGTNREQRAIDCLKTTKAHGIDTMDERLLIWVVTCPSETVAAASGST